MSTEIPTRKIALLITNNRASIHSQFVSKRLSTYVNQFF